MKAQSTQTIPASEHVFPPKFHRSQSPCIFARAIHTGGMTLHTEKKSSTSHSNGSRTVERRCIECKSKRRTNNNGSPPISIFIPLDKAEGAVSNGATFMGYTLPSSAKRCLSQTERQMSVQNCDPIVRRLVLIDRKAINGRGSDWRRKAEETSLPYAQRIQHRYYKRCSPFQKLVSPSRFDVEFGCFEVLSLVLRFCCG